MTTKRIIEIDVPVNDEQYKAFEESFQHFSDKVEDLPESWRQLDGAMSETGSGFVQTSVRAKEALAVAVTQTALIGDELRKATSGQKDLETATERSSKSMTKLAESARTVSHSVFGIAKFMTGIGAIGGIGAALGGIGSGLGIFALANSATTQSRTAGGLGLTPGQLNAFNANLSPFIGGGVLQGAANAQVDMSQWGYLSTLGVSGKQAQGETSAQIAIQEINAVRRAWHHSHNLNTAQAQAAMALGFSGADIRNIGNMNGAQLATYEKNAIGDAGSLGFSKRTSEDWIAFDVQLKKAGITIESSLIENLHGLARPLARLSTEVTALLVSFIKNDAPGLIKDLSTGLKWLGDYLNSKQFQTDFNDFGHAVREIGSAIYNALKFFNLIPGAPGSSSSSTPGAYPVSPGHVAYNPNDPRSNWAPIMRKMAGLPPVEFPYPDNAGESIRNKNLSWLTVTTDPLKGYDFSAPEKKYGLPPHILRALAMVESSGNPDAVSPKGAAGMFQLMPSNYNSFGIDPKNVGQESYGAALLLGGAYKKYGDMRKAIAAYNWGEGDAKHPRLDADIAKWGDSWEKHVPAETEGEITKVMAFMAAYNKAAGNAKSPHQINPLVPGHKNPAQSAQLAASGKSKNNDADHPGMYRSAITGGTLPLNGGNGGANQKHPQLTEIQKLLEKLVSQGIIKPAAIMITNQTSSRVHVAANAAGV